MTSRFRWRRNALAGIAAVMTLAACRYQGSPVSLQGTSSDISRLAGTWLGDYSSAQSGRAGSIAFTIKPGTDTAYGDVVMTPVASQPFVAADAEFRTHAQHATAPNILRVTFARVSGGGVEGALEPYVAPDCKCVVYTLFRGMLQGDKIAGEYLTSGPGIRQTGRWEAQRKQ